MQDKTFSIIKIMETTLNYIDPRLMNHGKRVAYLTFHALQRNGASSDDIRHATLLALLHDIGAYKTEEIDSMLEFETTNVWRHAIYSYLFLKYLSPLSPQSAAVLFHHADSHEMTHLAPPLRILAGVMHIADRLDILSQTRSIDTGKATRYFQGKRDSEFSGEALDFFFRDGWEKLFDGIDSDEAFGETFYGCTLDDETTAEFMRTIILSIDFRSPQTVTHTFALTAASRFLAEKMHLAQDERERIEIASMLHDIGKIAIPQHILEKPGSLTSEETTVMRAHVSLTEEILSGNIDERIVRLASRHHEKLNGKGYPHGLTGDQLTTGERLIAITDILSALYGVRSYKDAFPKEKVVSILSDMKKNNLLDPDIVTCAIENYDALIDAIDRTTSPIVKTYSQINDEYKALLKKTATFATETGQGEFGATASV